MIRLAKLTDYGIALMSHAARVLAPESVFSARELAEATAIPLPTVSKLLKVLASAGLLQSQRGVHGGYSIARDPHDITVAAIIAALEGPVSLTECDTPHSHCAIEQSCRMKPHWRKINLAVRTALEQLSLADMAREALPGRGLISAPTLNKQARRTLQEII